ncbi:MAG TPA: zinc ribbon domain-containing protein [Thermoanaerobaculia bacterium]|nr:zinc ribbon domain-containing protein [Thermoanaerobaculia bacterium]
MGKPPAGPRAMPIYEFYCPDCHTVFSFFSARINTEARPACPRCARPGLERKPSSFATVRAGSGEAGEDEDLGLPAGVDEERLGAAMESVFGELEASGEEDPRAMVQAMRRFGEAAGVEPGPRMEEMLRRLEAGEDPDAVEAELGGGEEGAEPGLEELFRARRAARGRRKQPRIDKELYYLESPNS